ncbi:mandelate racemase/muconate lactonizing enzyme family protein [Frondihabitans australicus]|uniref:L-alanine-DL-glutamate epimerase-like enolase superfamily enzyme n=1 Tax=Frondihabitans australicus TaxID=386892 RepID=A0A495IBL1_9MICO|nr:mandelate racemase/muconate lactonizing enzyme family protein [Frondihabitans australicus]RKR73387.1 L-alanine-DL-glutamate epimerase-like enolase superfamily enzyme [Frondihabitans australicus]
MPANTGVPAGSVAPADSRASSDSRIAALTTRAIRVPLRRPWADDVPAVTVIETRVDDTDGATGWGLSWTPSIGAASVRAMLDHDIASWAVGRTADARTLWPDLWAHLHEAGSGGVTTIATAGLDTALWDLAARRAGLPIADLLGRRRDDVAAYGSGVNLHYPLDDLLAQVQRWIDAGFDAVKIKVGSPDLARDVSRVREVRALLGDDRRLMLDANQRWSRDDARAAMRVLGDVDPAWIEEPLRADDLEGYQELAKAIPTPVACGENLHTRYRFREFARSGAAAVLQPNVVRVGGITPLLDIAAEIADAGATIALHLLPELSGPLALALDAESPAEVVEGAMFGECGVLSDPAPVEVSGGRLRDTREVGLGLRFGSSPEARA